MIAIFVKKVMIVFMKKICLILFLFLSACATVLTPDTLLELKGLKTQDVRLKMGEPVSIRRESNAQMWAYYQNGCSSLIFFDAQDVVQHVEQCGQCQF